MLFNGLHESRAVLEALPVAVAIYDDRRHLVFANALLRDTLGVADTTYRPGSSLAEHTLIAAHRGVFGPGDPEAQTAEIVALDMSAPWRFRRRLPDGRSFDAHYMPLPMGALMVCAIDITASAVLRDESERIAARLQFAVADLRIGLAVFTPDGRLVLHNTCFARLLGLGDAELRAGLGFEDVLRAMLERGEFAGLQTELFLAEQVGLDRSRPSAFRRMRANGAVLDLVSDPLPQGGWCITVTDISPLARAEDEARRRAGLLDSILRQLPHGVMVYGPDRRVVLVNEAYSRIMGGAPARVGDTRESLVRHRALAGEYGPGDPETLAQEQLAFDVAVPHARTRSRPDGRVIEVRTAPLPDGGHISVVTDVSGVVEAQQEQARTAELMASIVSHIPHGVSVYGPDRRLRLVNAAYGRIMQDAPIAVGDTVDEVIDRRAKAGEFGDGDPDSVAETQRGHARNVPGIRRRRRPNGTTIDIRTATLPDGGHISVVTDVTQLVEAEAGLDRTAAEMDAMLASIRHGIVLWDPACRIIASNTVAEQLVGAPPGHFAPGRALEDVVAAAYDLGNLGDGQVGDDRVARLLAQDRTQSHFDQRLTRAGRILEVRSDPASGGGFVTTYTDVTQIREAADALRLAKSAAEAANTAKSRFLAAMSSELRSPLGVIQTELAALGRLAGVAGRPRMEVRIDPAAVLHGAGVAADAARRLLDQIDAVLDVARLEAGRVALSEGLVDIPQLVRACLRKADSASAAGEVALVVDLPERLPLIRGDAGRLGQVLGHLVSNAIRHTPAMGSVSIGVRQEWTTGELVLIVSDTGTGMAPEVLERVFEPFAQTAEGTRAGLGLYLSRTLMHAHQGELVLRSTPGEGTTATLRVPAERVVAEDGG